MLASYGAGGEGMERKDEGGTSQVHKEKEGKKRKRGIRHEGNKEANTDLSVQTQSQPTTFPSFGTKPVTS